MTRDDRWGHFFIFETDSKQPEDTLFTPKVSSLYSKAEKMTFYTKNTLVMVFDSRSLSCIRV